jgi:hypothetical protein
VYMVALHVFEDTHPVFCGINGSSPPQTSLIYREDQGQWYYTTVTPMVRMNFAEGVSVPETGAARPELSAAPVVFDEGTVITYHDTEAGVGQWSLRDVNGRVAATGRATLVGNAPGRIELDGAALADGVYLFSLQTDRGTTTLRLVHQARR